MALIIKADMPKSCGWDYDLWSEGLCAPLQKSVDAHTIDTDCPIIGEIPDRHGRLISDTDVKALLRSGLSLDTDADIDHVCGMIDGLPTILEANNE